MEKEINEDITQSEKKKTSEKPRGQFSSCIVGINNILHKRDDKEFSAQRCTFICFLSSKFYEKRDDFDFDIVLLLLLL